MHRVQILSVPVDAVSRREVLARCAEWLRGGNLHHIVTANPELVLAARADPALRAVVGQGSLVVPDGVGLLWAARRSGARFPERIPGVELLGDLCRLAQREGRSVFFLGGRGGVAEQAARRVRALVAGVKITAFSRDHDAASPPSELWAELERVRPAVFFVAYGAPRQELWIARTRARLADAGVRIGMGVGGSFDILAGRIPRAPRVMRTLGLEWLWRLLQEPRRLPRIFRAVVVFPLAVAFGGRRSGAS